MILDSQLLFSNKQAVTATADSTNTIDLGDWQWADNKGVKIRSFNPRLRVFCQLTKTPVGMTSLQVQLKGSDNNSSWTTLADTGTVSSGLVAGKQMLKDIPYFVPEKYRFYKLSYTVVGTVTTAPDITAGLLADGVDDTDLAY